MKYLILFLLLILSFNGFCQVKGTVVDEETKKPITYSNVWIENENVGTTSDMNGVFQFNESNIGKNLIISAIGYESQHILIDSSFLEIMLVPKIYLISEILVKPKKKTELIISKYKKSQINTYSGGSPQIYARYFPYKDEYKNTPFIKSIKIETYSKIASSFNLRFLTVNSNGEPNSDLLKDNLIINAKKGKRSLVIDDFKGAQIEIPQEGIFIALEFLIIKENKCNVWTKNIKTGEKIKSTVSMPFIGAEKDEDINNGWVYSKGKWKNDEFNSIFTNTIKNKIKYCIAMEVILTD